MALFEDMVGLAEKNDAVIIWSTGKDTTVCSKQDVPVEEIITKTALIIDAAWKSIELLLRKLYPELNEQQIACQANIMVGIALQSNPQTMTVDGGWVNRGN